MSELFKEFEEAEESTQSTITVAEVDAKIAQLKLAREAKDAAKKISNEAESVCNQLESEIMGMLESMGKKSYEAEGVGRVTRVIKTTYKIPATVEQKKALYKYIQDTYGNEALTNMVSINHNTLNAWAGQEIMKVPSIPGLDMPTSMEYIQFKKKE